MDLEEPNDGQPSSLAPNAPRAPSPFFASPPAERIGPPSGVLVDVGRPYSPGPSLGSTQPPQAHPVPNQCQPSHGHPIPEDEFSEAEIVFDSPTTSMENIRARDPKQPLMSSPFTQTSPQTLSFQCVLPFPSFSNILFNIFPLNARSFTFVVDDDKTCASS